MDDSDIETAELSAEDLFFRHFTKDAEEPSKKRGEDTNGTDETEETDDESRQEAPEDGAEDQEDSEATEDSDAEQEATEGPKYLENDDVYVKVKVGDQEQEFSVKDLKRLAGQESALTRRSQEVSQTRKQLEETAAVQAAALGKLLDRAKARWEPYSKLDFFEVASKLDADSLKALKEEAQARFEDMRFLESELSEFSQGLQKERFDNLSKAAKECVKVLSDPVEGIEGWNQQMYSELVSYATDNGIPQEAINTLVDPASFKILRKAFLYDKGKHAVQKVVPPKKGAPKKIVKSSGKPQGSKDAKGVSVDKAMKRLKSSGSTDDAAEAFLARWAD